MPVSSITTAREPENLRRCKKWPRRSPSESPSRKEDPKSGDAPGSHEPANGITKDTIQIFDDPEGEISATLAKFKRPYQNSLKGPPFPNQTRLNSSPLADDIYNLSRSREFHQLHKDIRKTSWKEAPDLRELPSGGKQHVKLEKPAPSQNWLKVRLQLLKNMLEGALKDQAVKRVLNKYSHYRPSTDPTENSLYKFEFARLRAQSNLDMSETIEDHLYTRTPIILSSMSLSLAVRLGIFLGVGLLTGGASLIALGAVFGCAFIGKAWYCNRKLVYALDAVARVEYGRMYGNTFAPRVQQKPAKFALIRWAKRFRVWYREKSENLAQKVFDTEMSRFKSRIMKLYQIDETTAEAMMIEIRKKATLYRHGKCIEYWQQRLPARLKFLGVMTAVNLTTSLFFPHGAIACGVVLAGSAFAVAIEAFIMRRRLNATISAAALSKFYQLLQQPKYAYINEKRKPGWLECWTSKRIERGYEHWKNKYNITDENDLKQLRKELDSVGQRKAYEVIVHRAKYELIAPPLLELLEEGLNPVTLSPEGAILAAGSGAIGSLFTSIGLYCRVLFAVRGRGRETAKRLKDPNRPAEAKEATAHRAFD